jgi:hypothetical protein
VRQVLELQVLTALYYDYPCPLASSVCDQELRSHTDVRYHTTGTLHMRGVSATRFGTMTPVFQHGLRALPSIMALFPQWNKDPWIEELDQPATKIRLAYFKIDSSAMVEDTLDKYISHTT